MKMINDVDITTEGSPTSLGRHGCALWHRPVLPNALMVSFWHTRPGTPVTFYKRLGTRHTSWAEERKAL